MCTVPRLASTGAISRSCIVICMRCTTRTGHSRRDACHYQPKDEREAWFARDPITRFAEVLLARPDVKQADLDAIKARITQQIEAAVVSAQQAPQPTLANLTEDVFAP